MDDVSPVSTALVLLLAAGSVAVWLALADRALRGKPWIEYEPRTEVPWQWPDVLLLTFALLVFDVIVVNVAAVWMNVDLTETVSDPRAKQTHLGAVAVSRILWLAFAMAYLRMRSGARWIDLGFDTSHLPRDVKLGCLTFLAAYVPVFGVQTVLTKWFTSEHPLVQYLVEHMDPWRFALATLLALVIAPVAEEFLFRVVIQGWLEARIPAWGQNSRFWSLWPTGGFAIGISALLFALLHIENGPDPVALFLLALFLGYAYRRTHRLYASLVTHMCVNGLSMLQLWLLLRAPHQT